MLRAGAVPGMGVYPRAGVAAAKLDGEHASAYPAPRARPAMRPMVTIGVVNGRLEVLGGRRLLGAHELGCLPAALRRDGGA